MSFELIQSYFWLICGAWVGGGGAVTYHFGHKKNIRSGIVTEEGVRNFIKGWALVIGGTSVVFWLLQRIAGAESPHYLEWGQPYSIVALSLNVLLWGLLLGWVFFRDGAEVLSLYLVHNRSGPFSLELTETKVKILAIVIVASGFAGIGLFDQLGAA